MNFCDMPFDHLNQTEGSSDVWRQPNSMMTEHPQSQELEQYWRRTLTPARFLAIINTSSVVERDQCCTSSSKVIG